MAYNKIERPTTVIKSTITPISTELKTKLVTSFQVVINKIKEKHLS